MDDRIEIGIMDRIDFPSMIKDVVRQWWVILLLAISAALFANIWSTRTYQPKYSVSSTFTVSSREMNSNVYQNLSAAQNVAKRFSVVLESNLLKRKIQEELGLKEFTAKTSVTVIPETNMIELDVTAESAMEAFHVIHSILNNYTDVSDYVVQDVVLEMIQAPVIPTAPSNSIDVRNIMDRAFAITAVVVIGCFALLSYLKDTVKNEKEISEKVDARLLGTIYHERKIKSLQGIRKARSMAMLVQNPMLSFRFVESNRMTATRVKNQMERHKAKTLLVTSVLENEGKSTVAANLALSLAQENKRTLLIDCDFRKPAQYKIFGIAKDETINFLEMLKSRKGLDNSIRRWKDSNLYMICNGTVSDTMMELEGSELLESVFDFFKKKMDYIIVDTPPMALVADTEEIAHMADASVLVVKQDSAFARDINDSIDALNRTEAKVIGCIFNDVTAGFVERVGHYGYGSYYGYGGYYGKQSKE